VTKFLQQHAGNVIGALSGFDRVRTRSTMRQLAHVGGVMHLLWELKVLLKDFGDYMEQQTKVLRQTIITQVEQAGQTVQHLLRPSDSKEELVASILAQRQPLTPQNQQPLTPQNQLTPQNLVCVLSAVEPGLFYNVAGNRQQRKLELRRKMRPALHYYFYWDHPTLGLINARLASYFPYDIHICLNGRAWLAKQMDQAGLAYRRSDNCFTWIEDVPAAQALMDQQLRLDWPGLLTPITALANPVHGQLLSGRLPDYYHSIDQSEWATDVMFKEPAALAQLYPRLVRHGMLSLGCIDVMRFMGRTIRVDGTPMPNFGGDAAIDLKHRPQGVRLKHRVAENFIKMYDKSQSVLRVEMTINNPDPWKVYRTKEGDPDGPLSWRKLRKGVADVHRRAEVSQAANERYLDAAAVVTTPTTLGALIRPLGQSVTCQGKRVRALNPTADPDQQLLSAVGRGEHLINGFRNRDIRQLLHGDPPADQAAHRKQSAAITRQLRLLRAHGLIQKVPRTHRYQVTDAGRQAITALMAAQTTDVATLAAA
jgi:hypothetical protein